MFNDAIVVQSAVSAFNNAALSAPAFLWWALLSIPLYVMVYFCGDAFLARIGWNKRGLGGRFALTTVVMILCWVVLFGGNYDVLRDNISVLPFMVAAISFVASLFIGSHTRDIALPRWREMGRRRRVVMAVSVLLVAVAVGLSDTHAWWGPLLQVGAVASGLILGRRAKRDMRPLAGALLVMMATVVAILMQPEYFRFGMLGNLTPAHLLFLVAFGCAAVATFALRNINPRGRIHRSAYIKLKWMARFVVALGLVLFVMTESVPVFLGTICAMFVSCALSVWHQGSVDENIGKKMFAITLGLFGIITVMPVITAMGILYWGHLPQGNVWNQAKFLL